MPYALYLLTDEQNPPAGQIAAPAGFIYSLLDAKPDAIPEGSGVMEVPDGTGYFTHRIVNGTVVFYTEEEINQYFPPPKKWAQHSLPGNPPGFIHGFNSQKVTRPMDMARLEKSGAKQTEVDVHVDHFTHKVHEDGSIVEYTEEEKTALQPPTLSLLEHVVIALATGQPIDLAALGDNHIDRINKAISFNKLAYPMLEVAQPSVAVKSTVT